MVVDPPLPTAKTSPPQSGDSNVVTMVLDNTNYAGLHTGLKDLVADSVDVSPTNPPATWKLKLIPPSKGNLGPGEITDLLLILSYFDK
jgi:hypothetical protein